MINMKDIESSIHPITEDHSVMVGDTADVYLHHTQHILRNEGINPIVTVEFNAQRSGNFCGLKEIQLLLKKILPEANSEVWALEEGERFEAKEIALRITAPYSPFGLYETAICGTLASCSGWATAARECVDAATTIPVSAFAARHVHPDVSSAIDYASIVGGCVSCSTILGARKAGVTPSGSMPHALPLLFGDTVRAMQAFERHMPQEIPRVALVDTFKDEAEEALNVAGALKERLRAIRLDTAEERGGVSPSMVKEIRTRLDKAGYKHVEIIVSGGLTPERIKGFVEASAPVDGFLVGSYISSASPNDFTADIREIDGNAIAKKGRTPGITDNPRLNHIM